MALWNLRQGSPDWAPDTAAAGTLNAISVVASGTAHVKGAWSELAATTPAPVEGFFLVNTAATSASTVDTATLVDIGVGAGGSEIAAFENYQVGSRSGGISEYIPLSLPGGVRVAARSQSAVTSKAVSIAFIPVYGRPVAGGSGVYGSATSYGHDLATSSGVAVASGTNDDGSWVEITSATTAITRALLMSVCTSASSASRTAYAFDIGVGASGQEVVVVDDVSVGSTSSESMYPIFTMSQILACDIPTGARLSVRSRSSSAATLLVQLHTFR